MCGIAGFLMDGPSAEVRAEALLAGLRNRGPDDGWVHHLGRWTLVQTRLRVIDLSPTVRYPIPNETEDLWLLFNGEIYNHDDLRAQLEHRGHRFRTRCDAEVVLHGFEEWGTSAFTRLNGMWAIALLDTRAGELFLARDALGIKPLNRTTSSAPAFSSDATALVAAALSRGEVDHEAISEYLAFQYVPPPRTGLNDVAQVDPGSVVRYDPDGIPTVERWAPRPFSRAQARKPVAVDEADRIVGGAVARQMRADVPVGVFLSGGLDSSLVVELAVEAGYSPATFTAGFPGLGRYDETAAARSVATRHGLPHFVETISSSFEPTRDALRDAYDMPFGDPSTIATLPLARLARRHVTVALSGTGGDDLFAGYLRHRSTRLHRVASTLPRFLNGPLNRLAAQRGSERRSLPALFGSYLARLLSASDSDARRLYLSLIASATSPGARQAVRQLPFDNPADRVSARHGFDMAAPTLDQVQEFELRTYLAGDLLVKEDGATMAYGLEGRVPLLDGDVVSLAERTPRAQRARLAGGKVLLREVARRRVGKGQASRMKRGFAGPLGPLLRGSWRTEVLDWLRDRDSELIDDPSRAALWTTRSSSLLRPGWW